MKSDPAQLVVVMGVTGSGKSTLAQALAGVSGRVFLEADHFHPAENVERMRNGIPLTDEDRLPWLLSIRDRIRSEIASGRSIALACSALKSSYREILADHDARTEFVFLDPDPDTLRHRLADRVGHFAGASLLPSQFVALERPEASLVVPGDPSIEQSLSLVEAHLSRSKSEPEQARRTSPSGDIPGSSLETR